MNRRSDDRIRELCSKILRSQHEDELVSLCVELRAEIQRHVGHLRSRFTHYPFQEEKRKPVKE